LEDLIQFIIDLITFVIAIIFFKKEIQKIFFVSGQTEKLLLNKIWLLMLIPLWFSYRIWRMLFIWKKNRTI